jgi:hypothetical protein
MALREMSEDCGRVVVSTWKALVGVVVVLGGAAGLYGLHRLALWLEGRGHLYYRHRKPGGGAAGCFVALQRAVEPQAAHVLVVGEHARGDEGEAAGSDRPWRLGGLDGRLDGEGGGESRP